MALQIQGQLTIGDGNSFNGNTCYGAINLSIDFQSATPYIRATVGIWKSKSSFQAGKRAQYDINEIRSSYIIDSTALATSPSSNYNSLSGNSLFNKDIYWIHQKIAEQIVIDNPLFTVNIVDVP